MISVLEYLEKNNKRLVGELCDYVRFPSVSAQPQHAKDLAACADWVVAHCKKIGLEARVCKTAGNPIVLAKTPRKAGSKKPHYVVYGHYDVQPPEPFELWKTPPFEPRIEGDSLFARGSSDNKGQNFAHLNAVEAYLKTGTELPCDMTFLIEGEEEVGSKSLAAFLKENRKELQCEAFVISDTGMPSLQTSGADLCVARNHCSGNHFAWPVARSAFRRFRRRGGQSGNGFEPVARATARQKWPDRGSRVSMTTSPRFPPTSARKWRACQ